MCPILPRGRNLHPHAVPRTARWYLTTDQLTTWNQQAQDVNRQLWRLSGHHDQVTYMDIPTDFSFNRRTLALDGLHLGRHGHQLLADCILHTVTPLMAMVSQIYFLV